MKVFVSSTRAGLAEERDALPGLLLAVGHDPVVYEGFGARDVPSREACLRAVAGADAVVLLLGAEYGARMPDTGVSPTEEEWRVARGLGKPVFVFHKRGVEPTAEQTGFVEEVGDFAAGRFWAGFDGVGDLLPAVALALREMDARPAAPTYEQLPGPVEVPWRAAPQGGVDTGGPLLEVHVVPVGGRPFPARVMAGLPDRLTEGVRQARVVPAGTALRPVADPAGVTVEVEQEAGSWREARPGTLVSVRVAAAGTVSVFLSLPAGGMSVSALDRDDAADRIAAALRLVHGLRVLTADRVALAVGLSPLLMVAVMDPRMLGAGGSTSRTMKMADSVRVVPDESVNLDALLGATAELADGLAARLLDGFRRSR